MLRLIIKNDSTGDMLTGNYDYTVLVNDLVLAEGRLENHNRADGWQTLIARIAGHEWMKMIEQNGKRIEPCQTNT